MNRVAPFSVLFLALASCAPTVETGEFRVRNEFVITPANQTEHQVKVEFHAGPYAGVSRITVDIPTISKVKDRFSSALLYMKDRKGMLMNIDLAALQSKKEGIRYLNLEVRSKHLDKAHIHVFYRNKDGRINSRYDIDFASYAPYEVEVE